MATEYVIQGPAVHDLLAVDTVPEFPLGAEIRTQQLGADKQRIYKYVKASAAFTAGVPVYISSVNALLYPIATTTIDNAAEIGVPQVAITSPSGSTYQWVQTGGYFDNTGAQAGVGIYAVSATVNGSLYVGAGGVSTVPAAVAVPLGARALDNQSAANCYSYSPEPLKARRDLVL